MQIFKFGGVMVLAVQLFNKIKEKKNLKKKFVVKLFIFVCFRH